MAGGGFAGELLSGHPVLRTSDLGLGEELLARVLPRVPVRLAVEEGTADLVLGVNAVDIGEATASYFYSSAELHGVHHPMQNFQVNVTLHGMAQWRGEGSGPVEATPSTAVVLSPGAPGAVLCSAGCAQLCVMLPPSAVERELQRHLNRPIVTPIRFQVEMPLTTAMGECWLDALAVVCRAVERNAGAPVHPMAAATLQNLLVDTLLLTQPHNYTEELAAPSRAGSTSAVRRAAELLHDRPEYPWSVGELAEQVHLSVRALQLAFRRDTGDTPMRYLRRIRLTRVRATLLGGDPSDLTVTEVASRWGFTHLGHFAAAYRSQFGESPSETLHR